MKTGPSAIQAISDKFYSKKDIFNVLEKSSKNLLKMGKCQYIFTQLCLHIEWEYKKIVVEILG